MEKYKKFFTKKIGKVFWSVKKVNWEICKFNNYFIYVNLIIINVFNNGVVII